MSDRYESLNRNHKLIWNFRDIGHTMRRISEGKGSQKRVLIVLYETGEITRSMVEDLNPDRDYDTVLDECIVSGLLEE